MTQDEMKLAVAKAAIEYIPDDCIVGVGTGSTANFFIDELAKIKGRIEGTVASSEASAARLKAHGIRVFDLNSVDKMPVYVDGADEVNHYLQMVKGGGGALTREKIVAAQSGQFVCIADASKLVHTLGKFPLPVEVIPMATRRLMAQFAAKGGTCTVRMQGDQPLVTDNGQHILDVRGLHIDNPLAFESGVSQWPGVVTVGVFAFQRAHVCLLGTADGVRTLHF